MELWEHQKQAVEFVRNRRASYLDMAMGTGKSLVVVKALQEWGCKRVLIICPLSVRGVWRREFAKWDSTGRRVLVLEKGTTKQRAKQLDQEIATTGAGGLVVIVNYDAVWIGDLGERIRGRAWDAIVLDESHQVGNPRAARSKFVHGLAANRKLCLSGTPMDTPLNLWSQFRFLDPAVFGYRFHSYRDRYAVTERRPGIAVPIVTGFRNLDELQDKFRQHAYHAPKEMLDLLPTRSVDIEIDLSSAEQKVYEKMERDFIAEVREGKVVTASNALVKLLRLQQICGGCVTDDVGTSVNVGASKFTALVELLQTITQVAQVVVFGRFVSDLRQIAEAADVCGRSYSEISGSNKDALNELGQLYDVPGQVVGVEMRSGGVGIDLTRAQYGIYFSLGYSLQQYEQSLARLDRPGQTKHVSFYHLIARDTVDVAIRQAIAAKADVADYVLGKFHLQFKKGQ